MLPLPSTGALWRGRGGGDGVPTFLIGKECSTNVAYGGSFSAEHSTTFILGLNP